MIRISAVAEHLKAAGVGRVQGVIDYAALRTAPTQLPAHYVLPDDETAQTPTTTGVIDSFVTEQFQVVTVVAAAAARQGRVSDELQDEADKVRSLLVGWTPPACVRPVVFVRGRLINAGGGVVAYARTYRSFTRERIAI